MPDTFSVLVPALFLANSVFLMSKKTADPITLMSAPGRVPLQEALKIVLHLYPLSGGKQTIKPEPLGHCLQDRVWVNTNYVSKPKRMLTKNGTHEITMRQDGAISMCCVF